MEVNEASDKQHFFDDPVKTKRFFLVFFVVCAAFTAFDLLFAAHVFHKHTAMGAEGIPGFYPVYGFLGIVGLVLLAKVLRKVTMRGEDYYDS